MKECITREIIFQAEPSRTRHLGYNDTIRVTRIRRSDGYSAIIITVGQDMIKFTSENGNDNYEADVCTLRDLLDDAARNSCELPKS